MSNESATQFDWLSMLYLGGDNDLFRFGKDLLAEAQRVGSTDRVAVVAQQDPAKPKSPTGRGQVFRGRWARTTFTQTPNTLQSVLSFIADATQKFPAKKKMLIMWDHGNGWQNVHVFEAVGAAATQLRVTQIRQLLASAGIGVLCFDSCLMGMIEIVCELQGMVEFIVASENVVPADSGWPHDAILRTLTMQPALTTEQAACAIVDAFAGSYSGSSEPITLSALRVSAVTEAVKAIDLLARELLPVCFNGDRQKVMFARRYSQSFGNPDYIDLVSFCVELQRLLPGTAVADAAGGVKEAVEAMLLRTTRGSALSISGAYGVSIYFPDRPISQLYQQLEFAQPKTCMWSTFLMMLTPDVLAPQRLKPPAPPPPAARRPNDSIEPVTVEHDEPVGAGHHV